MNNELEIRLIDACKENRDNKTTSLGDKEYRSDIQKYLSEERFTSEVDKVFKTQPMILAHTSELPEPNTFQSVETPMGSVIVSRDAEGKVHAFYNSCRHRGARLVNGKGCNKRMICPYHAWSYSTDGKLANVPGQAQCFPELNKEDNGLISLACVEKYGLIWLCPGSEQEQADASLDTHLGQMVSHLEWLAPENYKMYERSREVWNGNWKLFAEGGLETYHFAFAHRDTIAPYFYNNTAVIDQLDQHFRVVMPTKALENAATEGSPSLHDVSHTLFYLLPNSAFLIQKAHVDWIHFRPLSADKTEITITSLIPADADLDDPEQSQHWQRNFEITNTTLGEDWALGASIQQSLSSGALPYIQYGRNEWALQALSDILDELLE